MGQNCIKTVCRCNWIYCPGFYSNAERVHLDIINKIEALTANPEIYPADKYKLNNNGLYRAFELHRFRIAYYIASDKIRILHVRHTSRQPRIY